MDLLDPEFDPALALWFTPGAIRDHFEDEDTLDGLSDEELVKIGYAALDDQLLYKEFHNALVEAVKDFRRERQQAPLRAGTFLGGKVPGVNVDKLNIEAGLVFAQGLNMDERHLMLTHYGLQRWGRGEEEQADLMMVKGIDDIRVPMTTWRMILAAAMAGV